MCAQNLELGIYVKIQINKQKTNETKHQTESLTEVKKNVFFVVFLEFVFLFCWFLQVKAGVSSKMKP